MADKTNIYIDCEWNDYKGKLISMALVVDEDDYLYEVVPCVNPTNWVTENVIPVLNKNPILKYVLRERVDRFLRKFDEIHIIADWHEDIQYLCELLTTGPGMRTGPDKITFIVDAALSEAKSKTPHNALADAISIMHYDKKLRGNHGR